MTTQRIALIIASTLMIAACGGGGGGGGSKPTPAPAVTPAPSVTPEPGTTPTPTPPPVVVEDKTFSVKVSEVSARRRTNGASVDVDTSELNANHAQQQ